MNRRSVSALLVCFAPLYAGMSGEAVYERDCAACHERFVPTDLLMRNFLQEGNRLLRLKGPTINQLAFRIKQRVGDPGGDREFHLMEVVEFIKDYVYEPDKQKSVCISEVLELFETMPGMRGRIGESDLEAVAEWIYFSDIEEHEK
jgi:hypothetical protein